MNTQKVKWYKSLGFKTKLLFILVAIALLVSDVVLMNTLGKKVVLDESSRLIEQIGNSMVSDLNTRIREIAALTRTLGTASERLPKSEATFKEFMPNLIDFQGDMDVAGGGVWPEPYAFDPDLERRSFFWGRNSDGVLEYYDDYNLPGSGYHNEEWYVVARHLEPGTCSWSKSYIDPYSHQPMVTCTVATYENGEFSGTVTIDLKLEGLQAFTEYWQKKTGGYIFIVDQHNKFITFPDPLSIKKMGRDEQGNRTEDFMLASEFSEKEPLFSPIANALDEMNQDLLENAHQMPGYNPEIAAQIDEDSYQIDSAEAELLSAIIVDPLVRTTFYKKTDVENDLLNRRRSTAYLFYVPETYWKVVIVKPTSEITEVASNVIRRLVIYLAIAIILSTMIAYFVVDWLLLQPLTRATTREQIIQTPPPAKLRKESEPIQSQQETLRQLLTPTIQIWEGVSVLSQIDMIDNERTSEILQDVLEAIAGNGTEYLIIDVTDVPFVDAEVAANHLVEMVQAVKLLGTECILVGISPKVVQALMSLDVDLSQMTAFAKLQHGLRHALSKMNYEITQTEKA